MAALTVGLVGYGTRLASIGDLMAHNGTEGRWWHPDEVASEVPVPSAPSIERTELEALRTTALVIVDAPLESIRSMAHQLGDILSGRHGIVHLGRTLDRGRIAPISTILDEEIPTRRFGHLTGPMGSNDIHEARGASALCASAFPEVIEIVREALASPGFRVYAGEDLVGAEAASAYARVVAAIDGVASARSYGSSWRSTLFARGLAEIGRFVQYMDGDQSTSFGLAGAGNLRADTLEEGSLDHQIGRAWARGDDDRELRDVFGGDSDLERLLETLHEYAPTDALDLDLLDALAGGLVEQRGLDWTLDRLSPLPG